jgi:hypothetical protein
MDRCAADYWFLDTLGPCLYVASVFLIIAAQPTTLTMYITR